METLPRKLLVWIFVKTDRTEHPLRRPTVLSDIRNDRDPSDADSPGQCGQPDGGGSGVQLDLQQGEDQEAGEVTQGGSNISLYIKPFSHIVSSEYEVIKAINLNVNLFLL